MCDNHPAAAMIAAQNDRFRQQPYSSGISGRVMMTQGIAALSDIDQTKIYHLVQAFDDFAEENDPYGEHDFGALTYQGKKIFWKIDYYDTKYHMGSEDPSDPEKTRRVLTIMLADEY